MTPSPRSKLNVTIIGCGKMGAAMIHGWIKADLLQSIGIIDPFDPPKSIHTALQRFDNAFHVKQAGRVTFERSDIVVLATKPQIMDDLLVTLTDLIPEGVPVLSIAAGKDIVYFQKHLGTDRPIIRTMPNTPASIGKGITALMGANITDHHKQIASHLFNALGETIWLDDESLMDAVTAISGSGPAYVFYLIEALAKAGEKIGLSAGQSMQLARQTVIGAAALAESEDNAEASTLRKNVTSPAGTTEAALNVLMNGELQDILEKTVTAARNRGKELSN